MKKGKVSAIAIIAISLIVLVALAFGYLQYRHYAQRKAQDKIIDEIMSDPTLFK